MASTGNGSTTYGSLGSVIFPTTQRFLDYTLFKFSYHYLDKEAGIEYVCTKAGDGTHGSAEFFEIGQNTGQTTGENGSGASPTTTLPAEEITAGSSPPSGGVVYNTDPTTNQVAAFDGTRTQIGGLTILEFALKTFDDNELTLTLSNTAVVGKIVSGVASSDIASSQNIGFRVVGDREIRLNRLDTIDGILDLNIVLFADGDELTVPVAETELSPVEVLERAIPVDDTTIATVEVQAFLDGLRSAQFGDPAERQPGHRSVGFFPHVTLLINAPIYVRGTTKVSGKNVQPYPTPEDAYASGEDQYGYRANTESGTIIEATADFAGGDEVVVIEADNGWLDEVKIDLSKLPRGSGVPEARITNKYDKTTEFKQTAVVWNPESKLWAEILGTSNLFLLTTSLPPGQVGKPYQHCMAAAMGPTGNHVYSFSGALPPGFTTTASGIIECAEVQGPFETEIEVTVTDGTETQTRRYPLQMRSASITDTVIYPATEDTAYIDLQLSFESVAPGATLETTWKYAPPGMALSLAGVVTGTPPIGSAGTYNPVVTLTDTTNNTTYEQEFEFKVFAQSNDTNSLFIDNKQLVDKNVPMGTPISEQFRAHGGVPPYNWDIDIAETATFTGQFANNQAGFPTATQNSEGMTLSPSGAYTGTPTLVGGGTTLPAAPNNNQVGGFVVRVTDSVGNTASRYVEFYLRNPGAKTQVWASEFLPQMKVGVPFSYDLVLPAEDAPYSVEWLQLPTGLSVAEINPTTYRISGTPAPHKEIAGVRTSWGSKVTNVTVINAPGAGIIGGAFSSSGSSENLKRTENVIIRNCFVGAVLARGSFDNRMMNTYFAGCLFGLFLGSGCSANTIETTRLEFTSFQNLIMRQAHENTIAGMLFDTAGQEAVWVDFCNFNNLNGIQLYRPARLNPSQGAPRSNTAPAQFSCGVRVVGGKNNRINNCALVPGSKIEGTTDESGITGDDRNFYRPSTGIYLERTTNTLITGCDLSGAIAKSIEVFGENPGLNIASNQYSHQGSGAWDESLYPALPHTVLLNGSYQSAERGENFTITPAGTGVYIDTIDGWGFFTEGPSSPNPVTQDIQVDRVAVSNESSLPFDYYCHITKPAEPGAVAGQLQGCYHVNRSYRGEELRKLSQRDLIFSYWVRSVNSTRVTPILKGRINDQDFSLTFHEQQFPTGLYRRRHHVHEFGDLRGVTLAEGDFLELAFLFSDATNAIDVELAGHLVQGLQEANYYPGHLDSRSGAETAQLLGTAPDDDAPKVIEINGALFGGTNSFTITKAQHDCGNHPQVQILRDTFGPDRRTLLVPGGAEGLEITYAYPNGGDVTVTVDPAFAPFFGRAIFTC